MTSPERPPRDELERLERQIASERVARDRLQARLEANAQDRRVTMTVRPEWALAYPQSAHLLREEVAAWQKMPWAFVLA